MEATGVIADVDRTMRALLLAEVMPGGSVEVSFEAPTRDWSARRTGPAINVYLADLRENLDRRSADIVEVRDESGVVVARRPRERVFSLTYALTAWATTADDDHELLGAALAGLLRHDYLPAQYAAGIIVELVEAGRFPAVRVGLPTFSDKLATELWGAVGAEYRPTLWVVIDVPIPAGVAVDAGPPQTRPPSYVFSDEATVRTEKVLGVSPDDPTRIRTRSREAAPTP